jgi:Fur family iron response transcriptional regulator
MENSIKNVAAVQAMLARHGINPTRPRVEIAQVLFSHCGHFSAEQILELVNKRNAAVSKATVYNTLKLLRDRGLVREVLADPSRVFYDANTAPHYHFYDVDTGELTDISADGVSLTGLPDPPPGVLAEGIDVVIRVRSRSRS